MLEYQITKGYEVKLWEVETDEDSIVDFEKKCRVHKDTVDAFRRTNYEEAPEHVQDCWYWVMLECMKAVSR